MMPHVSQLKSHKFLTSYTKMSELSSHVCEEQLLSTETFELYNIVNNIIGYYTLYDTHTLNLSLVDRTLIFLWGIIVNGFILLEKRQVD